MSEPRYPVGMATFSELVEGNYIYIDKTAYIKPLTTQGKFIFLSRPRRFGKSLLLSTLEAYFEGRRKLFKGLAADSMHLDWTPRPVLYLDLNTGTYDTHGGLIKRLKTHLERYEELFGISPRMENDPALRFESLIRGIHDKLGQRVVILVDEYDTPLLAVEENKELFERHQRTLKSFFSNLKSMDRHIEYAFITGVARFNKVSIFSDLNNLDDISIVDEYADLCGWSESELIENFQTGIRALAEKRKEDFSATLKELRDYYDGYLFTEEGSRLYNPFSILKALKNKRIDPYWFDTGTPTFLARRIRKRGTFPPDLNGQTCTRDELIAVGLNDRNPVPLMFQTGYLTIDSFEDDLYELRFPNREVEKGFYQQLLPMYVPDVNDPDSPFRFTHFKKDLTEGRPEAFMERLRTLLKTLPHEDHKESSYRAITFLLAVLSGTWAIAEHHGYKGRADLEVFTRKDIYVFEFKYNKSLKGAMGQILDRDYAGRYALDSRNVYLIAANFIEAKDSRDLQYEIHPLK